MRPFLILLATSTLAAAGPLPSFSNTTLEASAPPSIPANTTIATDPVADLTKLKAIYDNLNQTEPNAHSMVKRGFWKWLKDAFEAPGLKARSPDSVSIPDNSILDSDPMEALTKLKAVYDRLHQTDRNATLKVKRNFWKWLKDAFEAPGLKARSPESATVSQMPDGEADGSDPVAVLTKLKAVYDSQNEKRMESGVKEKRNFWQWLKDAFEAPGL